jgi:hypothetical protein
MALPLPHHLRLDEIAEQLRTDPQVGGGGGGEGSLGSRPGSICHPAAAHGCAGACARASTRSCERAAGANAWTARSHTTALQRATQQFLVVGHYASEAGRQPVAGLEGEAAGVPHAASDGDPGEDFRPARTAQCSPEHPNPACVPC